MAMEDDRKAVDSLRFDGPQPFYSRIFGMKRLGVAGRAFQLFISRYPGRFVIVTLLTLMAGFFEGLSFLSFVPILDMLSNADINQASSITRTFLHYLTVVGLPANLYSVLAVVVCIVILRSALLAFSSVFVQWTFAGFVADLRLKFISATLESSWGRVRTLQIGSVVNSMLTEAEAASTTAQQMNHLQVSLIQICAYLATAFLISWQFTALSLIGGGALMSLLLLLISYSRRESVKRTLMTREYASLVGDWMQNQKPLKAMGFNHEVMRYLAGITQRLARSTQRLGAIQGTLVAGQEIVIVLFLACVIIVAKSFLTIDSSALLAGILILQRLMTRFGATQIAWNAIARHEAGFKLFFERVLWLESEKDEAAQRAGAGETAVLDHAIVLEDVIASYGDNEVLKGIDLTFPAGTLTALVGPSGAGKSTILDLLSGLVAPAKGRVLVDRRDLRGCDLQSWRRSIGYVPQDVVLLHDTIRNNLSLGNTALSDADIEAALRQAGAEAFVRSRSDGIDAVAGERGQDMSGGQRQRLALARALIRKPRLLLLDEATSALDAETELAIAETLRKLTPGMTVVLSAHRPALEAIADQVVYLADGGIKRVVSRIRKADDTTSGESVAAVSRSAS